MSRRDVPGRNWDSTTLDPVGSATASTLYPIFEAPFRCQLRAVELTFGSAHAGDASHTVNYNVVDRGTAGGSSTELANKDYGAGTDQAAWAPLSLYAVTAGTALAIGQKLSLEREKVGNGVNVGSIRVRVEYEGR